MQADKEIIVSYERVYPVLKTYTKYMLLQTTEPRVPTVRTASPIPAFQTSYTSQLSSKLESQQLPRAKKPLIFGTSLQFPNASLRTGRQT